MLSGILQSGNATSGVFSNINNQCSDFPDTNLVFDNKLGVPRNPSSDSITCCQTHGAQKSTLLTFTHLL